MIGVLWAYEGWQYVTFSAGEAIDPQRTFPRAIVIGTASLVGIYLFANVGYLAALGTEGVAASNRVAAEAVGAIVGPAAAKLIAGVILVSIFSATNGLTISAPRVYYAMAKDGLFLPAAARVHPKYRTPASAIVAQGLWSSILVLCGTLSQLVSYTGFAVVLFSAVAVTCVFVLRRRDPGAPRPFRAWGYPWAPAIFVLACLAMVVNEMMRNGATALVGAAVIAAGVPVYFFFGRRH